MSQDDYQKGLHGNSYGTGIPTRDWYRGDEDRRRLEEQRNRQQEDERRRSEEAIKQQRERFHRDAMDRQLDKSMPSSTSFAYRPSGAGASPVVWLFGLIGAVMGAGYTTSQGAAWYVGAFFGFVAGGFLGGFLSRFKAGRIILGLIVIALIAGVAYEMLLRSDAPTQKLPEYGVVDNASLQISNCESAINLGKATGADIEMAVAQCNLHKESFMTGLNSLSAANQELFCKQYNQRKSNKTKFVNDACKAKGY